MLIRFWPRAPFKIKHFSSFRHDISLVGDVMVPMASVGLGLVLPLTRPFSFCLKAKFPSVFRRCDYQAGQISLGCQFIVRSFKSLISALQVSHCCNAISGCNLSSGLGVSFHVLSTLEGLTVCCRSPIPLRIKLK